jgi:DNA-binding response OmpR family regulator
VLLVEDNSLVALGLRTLFEQAGWQVRHAWTLAEAMELLSENPHWIVLDLMLPDGDGVRVLEEVRALRLRSRVAVTTGSTDPDRREAVSRLKPDLFMLKPILSEDLFRAMGAAR